MPKKKEDELVYKTFDISELSIEEQNNMLKKTLFEEGMNGNIAAIKTFYEIFLNKDMTKMEEKNPIGKKTSKELKEKFKKLSKEQDTDADR